MSENREIVYFGIGHDHDCVANRLKEPSFGDTPWKISLPTKTSGNWLYFEIRLSLPNILSHPELV